MKQDNLQNAIRKINQNRGDRLAIFRKLTLNEQAQAFLILSRHFTYGLVSKMTDKEVVAVLEHLDPDEVTDILQLFPKGRQSQLLETISEETKRSVERLMQFDPDTAGGLMDVDYIQVDEEDTIADVSRQFKVHEKRTGRLPVIIVLKQNGELAGFLPGHELGFARLRDKAKKFTRRISTIPYSASREDATEIFRNFPHNKMAVLGPSGQVMGIIYSDDVLRLMHEQEAKSLYDFAGVSKEENVFDGTFAKVRFRYKWLIINLGTAFLASFTVSLFDSTISKYVLLAVYMPIIAGMGGNAATQTMAVMVRGIALKQVDSSYQYGIIKKEVLAGLINGLINGVIVAAVVIALNRDFMIAFILSLAMVLNLIVAGFFGTIIPLFMKKIGKDPAASATIFITTATDVLGFLAFLGLAKLLLP